MATKPSDWSDDELKGSSRGAKTSGEKKAVASTPAKPVAQDDKSEAYRERDRLLHGRAKAPGGAGVATAAKAGAKGAGGGSTAGGAQRGGSGVRVIADAEEIRVRGARVTT